jgi:hypothetical protein
MFVNFFNELKNFLSCEEAKKKFSITRECRVRAMMEKKKKFGEKKKEYDMRKILFVLHA